MKNALEKQGENMPTIDNKNVTFSQNQIRMSTQHKTRQSSFNRPFSGRVLTAVVFVLFSLHTAPSTNPTQPTTTIINTLKINETQYPGSNNQEKPNRKTAMDPADACNKNIVSDSDRSWRDCIFTDRCVTICLINPCPP